MPVNEGLKCGMQARLLGHAEGTDLLKTIDISWGYKKTLWVCAFGKVFDVLGHYVTLSKFRHNLPHTLRRTSKR